MFEVNFVLSTISYSKNGNLSKVFFIKVADAKCNPPSFVLLNPVLVEKNSV